MHFQIPGMKASIRPKESTFSLDTELYNEKKITTVHLMKKFYL
jgi:hypothetical protein